MVSRFKTKYTFSFSLTIDPSTLYTPAEHKSKARSRVCDEYQGHRQRALLRIDEKIERLENLLNKAKQQREKLQQDFGTPMAEYLPHSIAYR